MIANIRSILQGRFRLSAQMYLGIGMAVALTLSASLVAWLSFNAIGEAAGKVSEESVPELVAAFGIAQYTNDLSNAAPRLTSAVTTSEFEQVATKVEDTEKIFQQQLDSLSSGGEDGEQRLTLIQQYADQLIINVDTIKDEKQELLNLNRRTTAINIELSIIQDRIEGLLIPIIDDQLFYTMTGYRELDALPVPTEEHFSETEFYRYRNLSELQANATSTTQLLANAFSVPDAAFIEPLRERAESAKSRIESNLKALQGTRYTPIIALSVDRLFEVTLNQGGGFDLLSRSHHLENRQHLLVEQNRQIAASLVDEVNSLVEAAEFSVARESDASQLSILQGRIFLIAISLISIVGAFLITWLFVGRILLRRIQNLSDRMLQMAGGDLETQVDITGQDEVADMAQALEVFRQHALEARRLNLVEELAEELLDKNDELERVLQDLQNAQDQIVTRGKLAALGELTAGVAHEIRNPLNFVNNFSEASEELLEELKEVIDECSEEIDEEQMELIQEIASDLIDNMNRIKSHGERANRIVQGMLAMGRGSTDLQDTDLNALVEEYSQLAYHSGRATDPDMNIEMKMNFDPDVPNIQAVPQDLGRVFLNLVTNAWHATEDKRDGLRASNSEEADSYMPGLQISTKMIGDDIEIRFKDNGTGMPDDVVDRIFNPFFTTKSTDRGTGLGLSLSNDIVGSHGGNITVETEDGEYTEFIIKLPKVNRGGAQNTPDGD